MVEACFAGEHSVKGKSEPQRTYRLDAIRHRATRFDAAMRTWTLPTRVGTRWGGRERHFRMVSAHRSRSTRLRFSF